jgi:signal peptidase I
VIRRLISGLSTALLIGLLAAWVVFLRPVGLGGDTSMIVIRGDSMEPRIRTGDLLIVRAAASYGVGDVVAYRVAEGDIGAGHVVVHRIVDGDAVAGFILLGDNNDGPDPWRPTASDVVGRAWLHIPGLGLLLAWLAQPAAAAAMATGVVVAIVFGRARQPATIPQVASPGPRAPGWRARGGPQRPTLTIPFQSA